MSGRFDGWREQYNEWIEPHEMQDRLAPIYCYTQHQTDGSSGCVVTPPQVNDKVEFKVGNDWEAGYVCSVEDGGQIQTKRKEVVQGVRVIGMLEDGQDVSAELRR